MSRISFAHGSLFSFGSRMTVPEEEPRYSEMSDEQLKQLLEEVICNNKILTLENDIFERYLMRRNPQCLQTMAQVSESTKRKQKVTSLLGPISSVHSFNESSNAATSITPEKAESGSLNSLQGGSRLVAMSLFHAPKGYRINMTHRMEMAEKEIQEMKKNLKQMEQRCTKRRANLTARLEDAELRIWETKEMKREFKEKILEQGVDFITGKIPAEKYVRFIENRLKTTDNMIEKLRLKTSNLKIQIKKVKQQLNLRRELSETLRPVEFDRLKIENDIHERDIEERQKHFLEMKIVFGRFNSMVTNYKQDLGEKEVNLQLIKHDIEKQKKKILTLRVEKKTREMAVEKAEQQNKKIEQFMDEYVIPDVLDLIKIQAELRDAKIAHKRLEKQYQKIQSMG